MRGWRSGFQILLGSAIGLCLALILHACQVSEVAQSSIPQSPTPTDLQSTPQPIPSSTTPEPTLPPETQAIVDSAAPNGLVDPPRGDVRLVVISDLNSAYGSTDYDPEVDKGIALVPFWNPDVVLCGGDMVAGQDHSLSDDNLRAMWAAFDDHVAAPLRRANVPFGFTIGNHDASGAVQDGTFLFQRERTIATEYWRDPAHDPGIDFVDRVDFPFYYTFEQGGVFFVVWDGSFSSIPPDKLNWVEQALSSERAKSAKMRVLLGHLPLYAVAEGRNRPFEVMANADQLREMLERHNVHTYISGHHHAYYPAHKGTLQLLHTGLLGSGPRAYIDSTLPPRKTITVVDIHFNNPELTTYTTYDIQTLEPVETEELPRFLVGHNGRVLRRDVNLEDLSAEEQSICTSRLSPPLCAA